MRESRGQLAQGHEPLLARQENVHQVRFGDVGEQHHLAALGELASRYVHESAGARAPCARRSPPLLTAARASTALKDWPQQGLAEQRQRRRIAFLDLAAGIEHQHAAGQAVDQRREACGEVLLAGARLAELDVQLCDLRRAAPRRRRRAAPKRSRTRGMRPCSSLRWLSMRSRDVAAIRSEESNFCALACFSSCDQPFTNRPRGSGGRASKFVRRPAGTCAASRPASCGACSTGAPPPPPCRRPLRAPCG